MAKRGEALISLGVRMAAKAVLHMALAESSMSQRKFARHIGADEKEVRRLLDPRHPSKIDRLAEALEALDWRMTITFEKTAA